MFYYLHLINYFGKIFDENFFNALFLFFIYIVLFILRWGYYLFFEILFNGKTLGKMIFHLRTIHYQGKFLDLQSIVLRNFVRLIDELPIIGGLVIPIPAFLCILINKDYRRIGDLIANTIVIKEEKLQLNPPDFNIKPSKLSEIKGNNKITVDKILIKKLSEHDLYVLRKFLNSIDSFSTKKRTELTEQMAKTIKNKLHDNEEYTEPEEYLRLIYMRHKNEH